jgi:FkbM family methyltransferase
MKKLVISLVGFAARILPMSVKQSIYRSPLFARLIRLGLNLAAPQGFTSQTVASGGLRGMKLALDLQTEKDYWLGTYEPELQSAITDLVKPGDIAFDVGANIGYITLLLARQVGNKGRVFAFEALPENQRRLHENVYLNQLNDSVVVIRAAVVECSRPVEFLVGPSHGTGKAAGSAGRQELQYSGSITVTGTSLDEFVYTAGRPAPQIIKMDIEGGEVLALPGMQRLLFQARPILLLELHGPDAARSAWELLAKSDYRLYRMKPGYPPIASLAILDWKSYLVALPLPKKQSE